ncbi:MAG: hypothetical protein ACKO4K_07400 [Flavobacteriales bacterium]
MKYIVNLDAKGNFYSSQSESVIGLYPSIKTTNGSAYMGSALTTGACNSCHGNTTALITAP